MAIGTPVTVGTAQTGTAGTTLAISTTATVAAGDHLIALCGGRNGGGVLSSVSGGGLTWNVTDTIARGTVAIVGIAVAHCPAGLASGTSITQTISISTSGQMFALFSVSGLTSGNPYDVGIENSLTSSTTPTTSSITTTQADIILFAARVAADNTIDSAWTAGASYTKANPPLVAQSTAATMLMEYRIVSSTGSYTASLTQTTVQCAMAVSAFKMNLAAGAKSLLVRDSSRLPLLRR